MADYKQKYNPITGGFNLVSDVWLGRVANESELPSNPGKSVVYVQEDADYMRLWDTATLTWKIFPALGGPLTPHLFLKNETHSDTADGTVVLGDLIVGNNSPLWSRFAGNITTTKKYLTQVGTGAISAVPVWESIPINVYNETPSGVINGVNKIFTVSNNFITNTTRMFLNGLRQQKGVDKDYIESGANEITFIDAPISGDILIVDYNK